MKILYCIPSLYNPGGMERVISEKVNYLASLPNYEITIVTTEQQGKDIIFSIDKRILLIHLDINFNSHYSKDLLRKVIHHYKKLNLYKRKLKQIVTELNIDVIVSLCGKEIEFLNKLDVECKKIAEIHFSMNYRKQFLISRHKNFVWGILGEIRTYQLKQSVKKLDKLIVLTETDKHQWKNTNNNIICIPNPNPLNKTLVSSLDNKNVISIGKLDAQKGYDMLIDTWKIVAEKHPDWILNIWGVGEWEQMLTQRIRDYKLTEVINLCGQTKNVVSKYCDSSIYVMSSRYEGLPMVLIEAMSCGLPLISFDCECGPRDIISEGIDGYLVETNNIKLLAEKICYLIDNESIRKQMGLQAKINVEKFSKNMIMKRWTNLFENL